ncbi:MAG: 16S rRNA (adenine(1518)-N(6)/adenine(1519)-N(6))-dimethyltransferase RsmA [bacterium]|nr:16S rRNA (adenine(1518)-N(6)/adenine(1519)-N(6))-dimethyltransferase RsmA [bacterium]
MGQKLGQNFLKNASKIGEIVKNLNINPGDILIEIGPGHGALTLPILEAIKSLKDTKLIAIEKDPVLADSLKEKIGNNPKFSLITDDIRKILPNLTQDHQLMAGEYKIVGNIPYYLTGFLLRQLEEIVLKPQIIVLTIQKEVAERIIAQPPKMNLLAASVQFWSEPKIISFISRKEFQPAPKVDSAIIELKPKLENFPEKSITYYQTIKKIFRQPRKTIKNNIRDGYKNIENGVFEKIEKTGIKTGDRPQNLSLKQLKEISGMLYNYK